MRIRRSRTTRAAGLGLTASFLLTLLTFSPAVAETTHGVWEKHELDVGYQFFTTDYSCQGLKRKARKLLAELGAKPDPKIIAYGCAAPFFRPSPVVNLKMEFETLKPVSKDHEGAVVAAWDDVRIRPNHPRGIDRGDCEFIQRFAAQVLPSFSTESIDDASKCVPFRRDGTIPNLKVRVLRPGAAS